MNDELSVKDKKTCQYTIRKIHKLPFGVPRGVNAKNLSALEGIVVDAYAGMKQDGRALMAYKGGHYERDLLIREIKGVWRMRNRTHFGAKYCMRGLFA